MIDYSHVFGKLSRVSLCVVADQRKLHGQGAISACAIATFLHP